MIKQKIMLTGYNFAISHLSRWINFYPNKKELILVIPKIWKGRGGRIIFESTKLTDVDMIYCYAFRINSYPLGTYFFKGFIPSFLYYAIKIRPTVIYNSSEINLFYALFTGIIAKLIGARHICFCWENILYRKKFKGLKLKFFEAVVKINTRLSDVIICGNKKADDIVRFYGAKKTIIMPLGGIDQQRFEILRENKKEITFLFAGELAERKGVHLIIQAFQKLLSEIKNIRLIFVGNGQMKDWLINFAKNNNLEDMIDFIPWVPNSELQKLYALADIFLYPSIPQKGWEEQFGYSMIEAMASSLPVIATKSGSIEEFVQDRKSGILVEPDNLNELYYAMLELVLNKNLREELGFYGRKYVEENFSDRIIAQKYHDVFHSI